LTRAVMDPVDLLTDRAIERTYLSLLVGPLGAPRKDFHKVRYTHLPIIEDSAYR
jgi:hypothetical protein